MNQTRQTLTKPSIFTQFLQKKLHLRQSQKTLAMALIISVLFHLLGVGLVNWRGFQSLSLGQPVNTGFILEAQLLPPQIAPKKVSTPIIMPTLKTVKTPIKVRPIIMPRTVKLPPIITTATDSSLVNITNNPPLVLPPKPMETPTETASDAVLPSDKDSSSTEEKAVEVPQKQVFNTPLNTDTPLTNNNLTDNKTDNAVIKPPPNKLSYNSYKLPYQLPENVQARYDTYIQDEASNSVKQQITTFQFKYLKDAKILNNTNDNNKTESSDPYDILHTYEAELKTLSNNTDTEIDLRYLAKGNLTVYDLRPTKIEESTAKKSMVATTIDRYIRRAVISSQEGFVVYDDTRQDLLSIIIQLGINQQLEPRWFIAGTTQDFKVYRPTGLTTWRFQSQGIETVKVGEKSLDLLYIKRVPLDDQLDYEEEQHLWLDPKRYGFPAKMRFTRQNGQNTEFILSDWKE